MVGRGGRGGVGPEVGSGSGLLERPGCGTGSCGKDGRVTDRRVIVGGGGSGLLLREGSRVG